MMSIIHIFFIKLIHSLVINIYGAGSALATLITPLFHASGTSTPATHRGVVQIGSRRKDLLRLEGAGAGKISGLVADDA